MLLGQYTSKVSTKRRVAVPAKFRKELGEIFILTRWYENCLVLVGKSEWEALLDRLTGETKGVTEPIRDTDRFLLGQAYELVPDEQGRVIIPEKIATFAQIGKEVVFLGLGNRVEVWDSKKWFEREDYITKNASEFIEQLARKNESK